MLRDVKRREVESAESRGTFIFDRESFVMRKWQILEFDGKPYYAFVPEDDDPFNSNEIASLDKSQQSYLKDESLQEDFYDEDELNDDNESLDNYAVDENDEFMLDEEIEERDTKPLISNGKNVDETTLGDLYQVKVEGSIVTLEKLAQNVSNTNRVENPSPAVKTEPLPEPTEWDRKDTLSEMMGAEGIIDEDGPSEEEGEEGEEQEEQEVEEEEEEEEERYEEEEEEAEEEEEEETSELTKQVIPQQRTPRRSSTIPRIAGAPLKCKACSETFGSAIAFRKHVAWTHKKKVCIQENGAYICAVCDFRTLKKSLFADHLERKHETWTRKRDSGALFPCEVCGFVCRSKHSLQSHFIRKHTDSWEHNCQFCDKKFKVKGDLTNHVRFHHKEKPINCDVCGKLCQNTGSLYVHQKWAHYKPKYECHICKRRMVTQENLDQHLITQHEQREKIVCARCGKTFTKKDSFKRHMAVHTGSKPHPCPICTKPFARQSQLRQHVLIHTGKRTFVCDICGKGFTQKPGLICHRKTHPGPLPPLPVMPIADLVRDFIAQNEESLSHELEFE